MTGIVHEHIDALVRRENFADGIFPRDLLGDVQIDAAALCRVLLGESGRLFAMRSHSEPNKVGGRFLEEIAGDGLAQSAIGAGD